MEEIDHSVPDPRRLVAVLADTAKLRIFSALVLSDSPDGLTAGQLTEAAGVGAADTRKALANLATLGLARQVDAADTDPRGGDANGRDTDGRDTDGGGRFLAAPDVFRRALSELGRKRDEAAARAFSTTDPARVSVLLNCFRDGKLVYLPEKFGKRQIVLEEIAQAFEPGTRYAEAEVNLVLRGLYPDYAALRRYLIDSAFLSREDGFYWRSGGTVSV